MALELLDGTTAATDITFATRATYAATPGAAVSLKCTASYLSLDIMREMFEQTTFCSTGWRSRIGGMKQLVGRIDGFSSKGIVPSDPLTYFANNFPIKFIATMDASCTLTGDGHVTRRHEGMRAAGNSEAGYDFESFGAVTSAWVTS